MTWLLLALAGGLGAVSRLLLDAWVMSWRTWRLPVGTLLINTLGSLVLGLVVGSSLDASIVWVLGTGFCGAFTTFSTASLECFVLARARRARAAIAYLLLTLLAALAAAGLGLWLASLA